LNTWPGGRRIAVAITVVLETWPEGVSPGYSVQTTPLKPGYYDYSAKTWTEFGAEVGVWRLLRTLDRIGIPATFGVNARCAETHPAALAQILKSGHEIAAHGYTQDQIQAYMTPEEERETIRRSVSVLENATGVRPSGWMTSRLGWTDKTTGFLADEGLRYQADSNDIDLPRVTKVNGKSIVQIPTSDFSDLRVLRASPRVFFEVYKGTFDFLYDNEPMAMLNVLLHCHSAGRPLIVAVFEEMLRYFASKKGVWFARYADIAEFALSSTDFPTSYQERYF
jgi:peptidoglycan/xylan/chitin deacetylase (PgdA/CDA1 family)